MNLITPGILWNQEFEQVWMIPKLSPLTHNLSVSGLLNYVRQSPITWFTWYASRRKNKIPSQSKNVSKPGKNYAFLVSLILFYCSFWWFFSPQINIRVRYSTKPHKGLNFPMSAIVYNCIIKDAFTLTINACVFKVITLTGSSTVISLKTIYSGENARLICKCKCTFKLQKKLNCIIIIIIVIIILNVLPNKVSNKRRLKNKVKIFLLRNGFYNFYFILLSIVLTERR